MADHSSCVTGVDGAGQCSVCCMHAQHWRSARGLASGDNLAANAQSSRCRWSLADRELQHSVRHAELVLGVQNRAACRAAHGCGRRPSARAIGGRIHCELVRGFGRCSGNAQRQRSRLYSMHGPRVRLHVCTSARLVPLNWALKVGVRRMPSL